MEDLAVMAKKHNTEEETGALHAVAESGELHAVAIWNLHVLLIPSGSNWVAQGVEIDYVAQGDSIEGAKHNFEHGLESSIDLNIRMYGNIEGLLTFGPDEVLREAVLHRGTQYKVYSQLTAHDMSERYRQVLPFNNVVFLKKDAA
ncbi:MAG: hypothetical protein ABSF98_19605 [Bryobacteraceae bacterium]